MLACVTDCEQIRGNPSNNSSAKQLFSFPKGPRFLHYGRPANPNISYKAQSDFSNRKTFGKSNGFGVSDRPELFPQKEHCYKPPPDTYTLNTSFKGLYYPGMDKKQRSATARRTRRREVLAEAVYQNTDGFDLAKSPDRTMHTFGVSR